MRIFNRRKTPAVRIALRRAERRANTPAEKAAVAAVLANENMLDAVTDELEGEHASLAGGPVTDFLSWLLDNSDRILAVVMKIVDLFT